MEIKYKVAILCSIIIGLSLVGYTYMNYRHRAYIEAKQQQCLEEVSSRAHNALGDTKTISNDYLKVLVGVIQNQRDECFKLYK